MPWQGTIGKYTFVALEWGVKPFKGWLTGFCRKVVFLWIWIYCVLLIRIWLCLSPLSAWKTQFNLVPICLWVLGLMLLAKEFSFTIVLLMTMFIFVMILSRCCYGLYCTTRSFNRTADLIEWCFPGCLRNTWLYCRATHSFDFYMCLEVLTWHLNLLYQCFVIALCMALVMVLLRF